MIIETREKDYTQKGITLVALIVTVVVLLIIAGVSISVSIGDNGLIQFSKDTKNNTLKIQEEKQAEIDELYGKISDDSNNIYELPATEQTKPYFPSSDFSKIEGTGINSGLVIKDKDGNEYVWIEVPRNTSIYKVAGIEITNFTTTNLKKIEEDLILYVNEYRDNYSDEYYSGCGISENEYNSLYNQMLQSVYKNGGFWIGRYEVGIKEDTVRYFGAEGSQIQSTSEQTPVIQPNKIPYNWVRCSQAQSLASTFAPNGYTSSLMFGIQWDLVCKYIENKGRSPGANSIQTSIKTNSIDWGNYNTVNFNITNTNAKYSENNGQTWNQITGKYNKSINSILLTTGATSRNCILNIYDLAGNLAEFTLEKSDSTSQCVIRGGSFELYSSASSRNNTPSEFCDYNYGFRVALY